MKGIYRSNNALGLNKTEAIVFTFKGINSIIPIKQLKIIPLRYHGGALISPINTKVCF